MAPRRSRASVNIILRRDYKGAATAAAPSPPTGTASTGTWRANGTIGFGDLARDRYNVFFNAEHFHRDSTRLSDVEGYVVFPQLRDSAMRRAPLLVLLRGNYLNSVSEP